VSVGTCDGELAPFTSETRSAYGKGIPWLVATDLQRAVSVHDQAVAFERCGERIGAWGHDVPMRTVTVIEAPTSAGGYAPGQEDGPRALLEAGLVERLDAAGVSVRRAGRVSPFRWRPDPDNPRAANAGAVIDRAGQVAALRETSAREGPRLLIRA
jgi:hypothetical protein